MSHPFPDKNITGTFTQGFPAAKGKTVLERGLCYSNRMISVVVPATDDEQGLVDTLASLVPAAVDGAVRDVLVVDEGSSAGVPVIADATGCTYIKGPQARERRLSIGAEAAKGPWLFFLMPGVEPEENWFREARQFIERADRKATAASRAATFQIRLDGEGGLLRRVFGPPAGSYGLLIHRSFYNSLGGFRHLPAVEYVDLVRRIGPTRIERLRASLFVADRAEQQARPGSGIGAALLMLRFPPGLVARLYG